MKRTVSFVTTLLLLISVFAGCTIQGGTEPTLSTASAPPTAEPTASPAGSTDGDIQLSTDVPDVIWDPAELDIQTSHVYENEQYIYLTMDADTAYLLVCDKRTGEVSKIDQDCGTFAYQDHTIYYIKGGEKGCSLIRLDLPAEKSSQLKMFDGIVSQLCMYKDKLYFVMDEKKAANDEPNLNLYSIHTDGTAQEKVKDNVAGFCFYKGKLYHSPMYGETGAAIYEYDMDTKAERKVTKTDNSHSFSAIFSHDKLVHRMMKGGDEILELKTGEKLDGFKGSYRAVYGQYIVYQYTTKQFTVWLMAYDTTSGKDLYADGSDRPDQGRG